jgi:hypothetical protein
MPVVSAGWRVLRRRDLPDEGARGCQNFDDDPKGCVFLGFPGRVQLPLGGLRRRRFGHAHAVGTGRVVRGGYEAPETPGRGPRRVAVVRPFRVSLMGFRVGGVVFMAGRFLNLTGRM